MEPTRGQHPLKTKSFEETQAQVDEVVGIMIDNFEKVLDKERSLKALDGRAIELEEGSKKFKQQTQRIEKKYRWKNLIAMLLLIGVSVVILIAVIGKS